jgi:putative RNA 2'-phosphotransferase
MHRKRRVRLSKLLSLVLRHEPEAAGIRLDRGGWAAVEELVEGCRRRGRPITREELDEVVATNDKGRFAFSPDGTRIRAVQGHSVPVDLGYELRTPPEFLYHGTARRFLDGIQREGLRSGGRQHVHLSPDAETAVKVGRRHGRPAVLRVDAGRMAREGHAFFLAENGVWLTERVSARYLERIEET